MNNDLIAAIMRIGQQNPGLMQGFMGQGNGMLPPFQMGPAQQMAPQGPQRFGGGSNPFVPPMQPPPQPQQRNPLGGPLVDQMTSAARGMGGQQAAPVPQAPNPMAGPDNIAQLIRQVQAGADSAKPTHQMIEGWQDMDPTLQYLIQSQRDTRRRQMGAK